MKKILIISGVVALVGFIAYKAINQYKLLMKYCFNLGDYRLNAISRDQINFEVDLEIKNNSDLTLEMLSYNLYVYLNGIKAAVVSSDKHQSLLPNQFSTLVLNVNINPQDIKEFQDLAVLGNILLDFKNTKIRVTGGIAAKVSGIKVQGIPVNVETTMKNMLPSAQLPSNPCV